VRGELFKALGAYSEAGCQALAPVAAALGLPVPSGADHTELFSFQLYPYASVYTGPDGMLGGEAADRVAGFWRAMGFTPPAEPDHLASLLGLYAACFDAEDERARHLRHALLWEHLLSWLPAWLARLAELAPTPYVRWGRLLQAALLAEAEELGPPADLPLHLRVSRAVEGMDTVLAAARSGVIVTRADLGRAARVLSLGLRQGERRYAFHGLLAQDGPAVFDCLAGEARRQAALYRSLPTAWQPVVDHWALRAETTAGKVARLAVEAGRCSVGSFLDEERVQLVAKPRRTRL